MEITNTKILTGGTVIFVRATFSSSRSSSDTHGVCYSTTNNMPTIADSVSTNWWDTSYFYKDIYYLTNLTPATCYYVRPFYTVNKSKTTIYGPVVKTYTTLKGKMTYSITASNTWPSTSRYDLVVKEMALAIKYLNGAGYIPQCSFTVKYDSSQVTAAFDSDHNMMLFNTEQYINIRTIIHEIGHFMDYRFMDGLSHIPPFVVAPSTNSTQILTAENFAYIRDTYGAIKFSNAAGYLLGKKLLDFCHFVNNNNFSTTMSHASHAFPFTDYYSSASVENYNFQVQLHWFGAYFNVVKGYDGLIGISNKPLIVPFYSIDEGQYYIRSCNSNVYLSYTSGSYIQKSAEIDDSCKWEIKYVPSTGFYSIKNISTEKYLAVSSTGISSSIVYVQIAPTLFDAERNFENYTARDTFALIASDTSDTSNYDYDVRRNTISDVNLTSKSSLTLESKFNPREFTHNFEFIPV